MFHGVSMQTQAPQSFERKALRERLMSIESDEKRIGEIVSERTKLGKSRIDEFFLEAKTLMPSEAMDAGIVDEVSYVSIPKGSPIYTLTPQR
jgi:ATP-dependent protease ClpP protease subunit